MSVVDYIKSKMSELQRISNKMRQIWILCDTPQQYIRIINHATQMKDGESILDMYIQSLKNKPKVVK